MLSVFWQETQSWKENVKKRKENVILKSDFENALNSINIQFMLEKKFEIQPEVYKYSHSTYSQLSFLLYRDSVTKLYEETQQGDPESPAFFWFHSGYDWQFGVEKNFVTSTMEI